MWVLAGQRAGDNTQSSALAEALGWPYETKRVVYRQTELISNLAFDASLLGRVRSRSDPLEPPWPDLVISTGRRSEPVARWIRRRADRSVTLVHVGRPWRGVGAFDLVVVTPQYPIAAGPCVVQNPLPMHRLTQARLAAAAETWRTRLEHLPRPRIALLAGGNSELFTLDERIAAALARDASALAREAGGSLLVTTSARTPTASADALFTGIAVPSENYRWDRPGATDNPYLGFLALADAFIVTGDSISMLAEACATGRPVHIFDPGRHAANGSADFSAGLRRRFQNFGLARLGRDLRRIHDGLLSRGSAVMLGDPFEGNPPAMRDYLSDTAARVRRLLVAEVQNVNSRLYPLAGST